MTTITVAILAKFMAIASIILLLRRKKRSECKKRRLVLLDKIAQEKDWNISIVQCYRDKCLALEQSTNYLIYIDGEGYLKYRLVNLRHIRECNLIQKSLNVQLELVFDDQLKAPLTIPFFRKYTDPSVYRLALTKSARKWKESISKILENSKELEMNLYC